MSVPKIRFLTERESQILDAIVDKGDYEKASAFLSTQGVKISVVSMRQTTLRIRARYDNAKRFVTVIEEYQQALSRKDRKRRYFTG